MTRQKAEKAGSFKTSHRGIPYLRLSNHQSWSEEQEACEFCLLNKSSELLMMANHGDTCVIKSIFVAFKTNSIVALTILGQS